MCSAIAYAALKEAKGETGFVAARCGNSNARIDTILSRFRVPLPHYLSDVSPRVRDVMTGEVVHVNEQATCAEALELIDRHHVRVLPVANTRRKPVGLISLAQLLLGNWIFRGLGREGVWGRDGGKTKAAPLVPHTEKAAFSS